MPRQARIDAPGAIQHIIIRGIERKNIFRDTVDKDTFIGQLGKIVIQTSTPCYARVLMDNCAVMRGQKLVEKERLIDRLLECLYLECYGIPRNFHECKFFTDVQDSFGFFFLLHNSSKFKSSQV